MMRLLKIGLYLILSLCLLWGATVTLGPAIVGSLLSRSFTEQQLSLTDLAISPKLEISASRAEFDFRDNGQLLYGAVRAPKMKISLGSDGWVFQLSSGLLQVNDRISLPSLKADFRTLSLKNINVGQFSFTAPDVSVAEDFTFGDINVSSRLELSSSNLHNLKFSAKTASILDTENGDNVMLSMIEGRLAKFSLSQDWRSQKLKIKLGAETSQWQFDRIGKINIQSLLLEAQNNGPVMNAILMADSLSKVDSGIYLKGFRANPSIDLDTLKLQNETVIQSHQGRFEHTFEYTKPNKILFEFNDLKVFMGLHSPERYLKLVSDVSDVRVWKDQLPLITIPKLALELKARISPLGRRQDARAQFKAVLDKQYGPIVTGELSSQLSNFEGQDCLIKTCAVSDVVLDVNYEFEGEKVTCKGRCPSGPCDDRKFSMTIETSNTPKILMGLSKQKIINPLAVLMLAGSITQGQEIGNGHKFEF